MRKPFALTLTVVAMFVVGCNKPKDDLELTSSSVPPPDNYGSYESTDTGTDGNTWGDSYLAQGDSYDDSGGGRVHVVQRHDTLFALARSYYGDASQWRKIYQANGDQISDPNRIKVGMKLVIP